MPESMTLFLIVDNSPQAEDDFYVLAGEVWQEEDQEVWRDAEGRWIPLRPQWRENVRPVTPEVADILGSDSAPHFLPLVIRSLPENGSEGSPLGWKLPH